MESEALSVPRTKAPGNTLPEYVVIGCSVLLVAIVVVMNFGGTLNDWLGGLHLQMGTSVAATGSFAAQQQAAAAAQASKNITSVSRTGNTIKLTAKDGTVTELALTIGDLKESIVTNGANGTTKILSQKLMDAIQKLKDEGKIDDSQANQLAALANNGFRLADIEKMIEQTASKSGSTSDFNSQTISYNGKQYSPVQLANMLGRDGQSPKIVGQDVLNEGLIDQYGGSELLRFVSEYNQVQSTGAMKDPEVKSVVDSLVTEIVYTAELVEAGASQVNAGNAQPSSFTSDMGSKVTYLDSSQICTAGGGNSGSGSCP